MAQYSPLNIIIQYKKIFKLNQNQDNMGFFDFLKKKKQETKEIKLEELDNWLDSLSKNTLENINPQITSLKEKITQEKIKLSDNIKKLATIELKNPNIPERAKHIMEGNRTTYIQKLTNLSKEIKIPEQTDQIITFHTSLTNLLNEFTKATNKSHHILMEFFVEEISNISTNMRNIINLIEKIKKLIENSNLEKIPILKKQLNQIQEKIKQKQELESKIKKQKQELESKNIIETENQIKELEQSQKYKTYIELTNKEKTLKQEIIETENKVSNSISLINPAFKKYERLSSQPKLIRKYLDNPLKSLLEDKELKITEVISKMKQSIIKEELQLKKKKKEKILQIIDNFTKDYLKAFITKINELNKESKILKLEIEKSTIIKEINNLKEKSAQNKAKLKEQEQEISKTTKELQQINIESLKTNLQNSIRKTINQAVKIL